MRKTAIAALLLSSMIAAPAVARDNSWYAGIDAGLTKVEDIDFDLSRAGVATNNAYSLDHKTGFDFGGNLGYDFGMFRTEFEVAYKTAKLDAVDALGGNGFEQPAGTYATPGGSTRALSFMLNGLLDFGGESSPWSAFVGGGVGIARVQASNVAYVKSTGPGIVDDSDSGFAWQALAGVRRAVSDNVDVSLKYRYFNAPNVDLVSSLGDDLSGKMRSHSLLLGLTYNFGKKAEAAPPPPPPAPAPVAEVAPPPPPPPAPAPAPGPFIVFFDWDKADITPEAADILNRASEAFQQTGQVSVMLAGHADRSGSDQYNMGLSERRAAAVREYMAGKGVSAGAVSSQAFGESRPLVETADGVREPQNRRVEINFGAPAGN